jgi:hypothetical protein
MWCRPWTRHRPSSAIRNKEKATLRPWRAVWRCDSAKSNHQTMLCGILQQIPVRAMFTVGCSVLCVCIDMALWCRLSSLRPASHRVAQPSRFRCKKKTLRSVVFRCAGSVMTSSSVVQTRSISAGSSFTSTRRGGRWTSGLQRSCLRCALLNRGWMLIRTRACSCHR